MKTNLTAGLIWLGLVMVIAGIYFWLGIAGALICSGLWFLFLGLGADYLQSRINQAAKKAEEPKP
jgi:hypothetical protein